MNITKNKKGFTLVELLAVIVILALIMSIAIVSMTGIMENARYSSFNDTARSIINGVRSQLLAANELRDGSYYFDEKVLENTGNLPFGSKINFTVPDTVEKNGTGSTATKKQIGSGIYRSTSKLAASACTGTNPSFVNVTQNSTTGKYEFSICIGIPAADKSISGVKYMALTTETALQNDTKAGVTAVPTT